jgi:Trypsin-like peptidase domain/NB-ARC domain
METAEADRLKPPLYVVRITGDGDGVAASGTGFVVTERGHVATCLHVARPAGCAEPLARLKVSLPYPAEQPYAYKVIAFSEADDLALLESLVPLDFPLPQPMLHEDWARDTLVGSAVTAWGYSAAEHYTRAQRFDARVSGLAGAHGRIGLAIDLNPGDSGGPVLDGERQVIGIAQARDRARAGQAMAIPVSLLRELLQRQGLATAPAGDAPAAFEAPEPPEYALVGRAALLAEVKQELAAGQHVALCFKPGVGKSAVAIALANDADLRRHFKGGVLWASLNLTPNVLSELKRWATELKLAPGTIEELNQAASTHPAEEIDRWAEALAGQIGERRMLLVVDDAWELEPARALLLKAPNCAYLVTTREQAKVAAMLGDRFATHVVDELSREDGLAFLGELAPNAVAAFPDKAREVVRAVGGLPQGLLLLGMYLKLESREKERVGRIERAFANVLTRLGEYIAPLHAAIRVSYDALPSDAARTALCALSIFRAKPDGFTEGAALAVLDAPSTLLDTLNDAGLIETLARSTIPADEDGALPLPRKPAEDPPYTMHRTIDDFASALLPADEAQQLHRRAASYFAQWLQDYETDEEAPARYGDQYRYENKQWQYAMDEFLYHLARAGDPTLAVRAFGRIYFSAFWWWGCFAKFPFCTRLLRQAASKRLSAEARAALELLVAFDVAYPKEGNDDRTGDWAGVEAALTRLRALGGLDTPGRVDADPGSRQVRALTDIFLAEALRFGRGDVAGAETLYREALALFPEGDWSRPWVRYHLADMFVDAARHDDARREVAAALALAEAPELGLKERDNEVIANAWCVRAALAAAAGDGSALADSVARAVLHAYAFQAIPIPPDPYTVLFYRQMVARVCGLIGDVGARDRALAIACCSALRRFWQSYRELAKVDAPELAADGVGALLGRPEALGAYLFPAAPPADLMYVTGSRYVNEAITVFNEKYAFDAEVRATTLA